MLKKTLSIIIFVILVAIDLASAQCTPDSSMTSPGIKPEYLDTAYVGVDYSQTLYFLVPPDTTYIDNGNQIDATIDSISVLGVDWNGLDAKGFTYECNPNNCTFLGGSFGCVTFHSATAPTKDMAGTYPLVVHLKYYVKVFNIFPLDTAQDITDFSIIIKDTTTGSGSGIFSLIDVTKLQVLQNTPNPFSTTTSIEFASPSSSNYQFEVYNMLGEKVYFKTIEAKKGMNKFSLNSSNFKEGVYLYSLGNDKNKVIKKMTVSE